MLKSEWLKWWRDLSGTQKWGPLLLVILYWVVISKVGKLSADHFTGTLPILILYYGGPRLRPVFYFLLPLFLTIIVYDSQRYYADYLRSSVIHVREPYDFDRYFFGIRENGELLTPAQWFQRHTLPILDLISGFFYIAFVPIFVLFAAYFRFWVSRNGTDRCSAESVRQQSTQIMWSFFWLNVVGFSTYYWYPASPPWYADIYGFGPAIVHVPAEPAGCARFDLLLGTHIFNEWYGRAADVHGAIPSLHIAYPLLAVFYAFKFGTGRTASIVYFIGLCFSAVYVNQHYVLDIILGSIYALVTACVIDRIWSCRLKRDLSKDVLVAAAAAQGTADA